MSGVCVLLAQLVSPSGPALLSMRKNELLEAFNQKPIFSKREEKERTRLQVHQSMQRLATARPVLQVKVLFADA
jgi:hypothetical protein